MKKKQGLKTLGDYRRAAKDSLFDIFLPPESKSTSPFDAIKTALRHSKMIILCSRYNFSEGEWWGTIHAPDTKYEMTNYTLFECIKLMEFVKKYHEVQSINELFPNWPPRPNVQISFFTDAGLSYLEVAFDFVRKMGSAIIGVLQVAYCKYEKECNINYQPPVFFLSKTPAVDDLEINPVPDIIIKTWFDDIMTRMRSWFLKSDYSRDKVEAEFNRMEKQLEHEWDVWKSGKTGDNSKITKLTDFIINNCEDTPSVSSKVNRIHEFVKNGKIKFMPKPINKTKGNQTKLYVEEKLRKIWPQLKLKIKSLPNLKA